jgi:signal transduction histidine kinase
VEQVNHVLSELRTVIYQLRPAVMKEQEIGEWVVNLCRRFQQATGITVDATVSQAQNREVAPEVTIALLRLVQEALANTYQHSGAKSARLALDFSAADVRLRLEDEGRGFDTGERRVPRIEGGHGLGNMEERVRELGGTLSVESAPGRGVRLEAVIPR